MASFDLGAAMWRFSACVPLLFALQLLGVPGAAAYEFQLVAQQKGLAPDALNDQRMMRLFLPQLTAGGKIALSSDLFDTHGSASLQDWTRESSAIWFGFPQKLERVLEQGQDLPGKDPGQIMEYWPWPFVVSGEYMSVSVGTLGGPGYWGFLLGPDQTDLMFRQGTPLSDGSIVREQAYTYPTANGNFAFYTFGGPRRSPAVWVGGGNNATRQIPGAWRLADVSNSGLMALGKPEPGELADSLWIAPVETPEQRTLVASSGAELPGVLGASFRLSVDNRTVSVSDSGQMVIRAHASGPGIVDPYGNTVLAGVAGDLWTVQYPGMPVHEVGEGWKLGGFSDGFFGYPEPKIGEEGDVFMRSTALSPEGFATDGLWHVTRDKRELVALAGQDAPGLAPGQKFDGFGESFLNAAGQFAFDARFWPGPSNWPYGTDGIWLRDPDGTIRLIARSGDILNTDQGDIVFETGDLVGLDDAGNLLISVNYRPFELTQSLIYVSTPEPSSVALAVWASVGGAVGHLRPRARRQRGA